jgi:transcription elongation factor Elf1
VSALSLTCPFCDSEAVETVSDWGGQLITRQMRCRSCNTYFEAVRAELGAAATSPAAAEPESPWTGS